MKQHLLFLLLAFAFSFSAPAQSGNGFKKTTKNQSGTTHTNLTFSTISGNAATKSTNLDVEGHFFPVSRLLAEPELVKKKAPRFFEIEKSALKSVNSQTMEAQFYAFHKLSKQFTLLSEPETDLKIIDQTTDNLGITHIKAQQYFKDIKVHGAESFVHFGSEKNTFNGTILFVTDSIDTTPTLSAASALNIVNSDLSGKTIQKEWSKEQKEIVNYEAPVPELVIYENTLAYEVSTRPNFIEEWKYFIDAHTGKVIQAFNNTKSDGPATANAYDLNNVLRTIHTYLDNGSYLLLNAAEDMFNLSTQEGIILTLDANNTSTVNLDYSVITSANNSWTDKTAVSAHYSASATYKYLENTFGRQSINGQGGNIISFINVANEDGSSMENAFWNGQAAFFGNGGSAFYPLAGGLDVIAHEFGHGVVSNTANLEYQHQSGAINETYADIFGSMVDRQNWLIGENVTKTSFIPSGALRNMADPHNTGSSLSDFYWQPKHVSEMYIGNQDNGGVHINSGIGNYAYYLYASAVSKEKAEKVFYRALTTYLTSKAQFIDFRIAVTQAAKDLYGENSTEAHEAATAFDAVGIYDEESIDYEQDYEINPGQDYLLTYDVNPMDANTLYRSSVSGTNFYALTTTSMKGRVSVSDDGKWAVFVAPDDKIKVLSIDPNNIQEYYLSDEAFFDNVAISKDGNRLAAISTEIDAAIYVYDFNSGQWAKFDLYNPTTSHSGTDAGGVLYADAIEFDHSGEFLIYDAYNELNSSGGEDISYWDIGFIRVWDNSTNSFGNGNINKLYGSLPDNVSIGNPTFSKNSPYIIAFDYLDGESGEYAILGANLLTGDLNVISMNSTIGYPSFSKNDDVVAFSALTTTDDQVVASVALAENKISGSGSPTILVDAARWPVFYTVGTRELELEPVANFTVDTKSGEVPVSVQFMDLSINNPTSWSWTFEGGSPATSTQQNPDVTYYSAGTYQVSLSCSNNAGTNTITKTAYITVTPYTSVNEIMAKQEITFYPNPTDGIITFETDQNFEAALYSASGAMLLKSENEKNMDLSPFSEGLYILHLKVGGKIYTEKIIRK